jgi:hypothetical protein
MSSTSATPGAGSRPAAEPLGWTAWYTFVRLLLSAVFFTAAWVKLRDPTGTLIAVYQYQILSWENSEWLALALPWFEGVTAAGLWFRRTRLGAHVLLCGMLAMFLVALAAAFVRRLDISCGCFGSLEANKNAGIRLAQDVVLLGFCLPLLRRDARLR